MRRVLAIASISLRNAVRSRVLAVLLVMLAVVIVGLPLTVRGDGTPAGHVQILLRYTLGFVGLLLSVSTLWSGCAAVSTEVQTRRIHLVVTKPVHVAEVWLGKWLGLLALNAVLLAFSGAVVYGLLWHAVRGDELDAGARRNLEEEVLVARASSRPVPPDVDAEARRQVEQRRAEGALPGDADPRQVLAVVRQMLRAQAFAVPAGRSAAWTIPVRFRPRLDRQPVLQFRFSKSQMDLEPVRGRWVFGEGGGAVRAASEGAFRPEGVHTVPVPAEALEGGVLALRFENLDERNATVFFDPDDGIELLVIRGGFLSNYARALLVLFVRLAFLAAVGLAAGSLFSLPVAAFAALSCVTVVGLGAYVRGLASRGDYLGGASATWLLVAVNRLLGLLFRALGALVRPLQMPDVLDLLAGGRLVPWALVGRQAFVQGVLYAGALAALCSLLLRRREMGLPS